MSELRFAFFMFKIYGKTVTNWLLICLILSVTKKYFNHEKKEY